MGYTLQLTLHLLRQAGPDRGVRTGEFLKAGCGSRFGGRILELREMGHVIETERIGRNSFLYKLTRDAGGGAERGISTPTPSGPDRSDHSAPTSAAGASLDADPDSLFDPGRPPRARLYDVDDEAA